jgi:hypothetical protein
LLYYLTLEIPVATREWEGSRRTTEAFCIPQSRISRDHNGFQTAQLRGYPLCLERIEETTDGRDGAYDIETERRQGEGRKDLSLPANNGKSDPVEVDVREEETVDHAVKCGVGTTDGPQELLLRVRRQVDLRRADDAGKLVENILRERRGGFLEEHGDDTKEKAAVDAVEFEEKAAEEGP